MNVTTEFLRSSMFANLLESNFADLRKGDSLTEPDLENRVDAVKPPSSWQPIKDEQMFTCSDKFI
jgi:hypothetical protein